MIVHDVIQGSPEWMKLRLGIPTASRFDCIITPAKLNMSKQAIKYAYELVAERITGESVDAHKSKYMERGSWMEDDAGAWYDMVTNVDTQPGGFVTDDKNTVGCSTDGMVGNNGTREIKCCSAPVHVKNLCDMEFQYRLQTQGCLWITGREWCDLVAYNPVIGKKIIRIERDEEIIEAISNAITEFRIMVDEVYKSITKGVS